MARPRPILTRRLELQIVLLVVGVGFGALPLYSNSSTWRIIVPIAAGAIGSTAVSVAMWQRRAMAGPALLASVVLFTLVALGLVRRSLSPTELPSLWRDLTESWRMTLDTEPPLPVSGAFLAVPLTISWVGGAVSCELCLRTRGTVSPLVGTIIVLAAASLFGGPVVSWASWVGAGLLVASTGVILARAGDQTRTAVSAPSRGSLAFTGLALVVAAALAPAVVSALPFGGLDRYTLREGRDQVFDQDAVASPLALLAAKRISVDEQGEPTQRATELFTVSGEPVDRLVLAVLSAYDDDVFRLRSAERANFTPVGPRLPVPREGVGAGEPVTHTITVSGLTGSWLPSAGAAVSFEALAGLRDDHIRFDLLDGNLISRDPLVGGDSYEVTATPALPYRPEEGLGLAVLPPSAQADAFQDAALRITGASETSAARLDALIEWFASTAYVVDERPGHYVDRLVRFVNSESPTGYEEQVAAAFALLAQAVQIETRVVVGYEVTFSGGTATVTSSELSAWNEVKLTDGTWRTIDVTPDPESNSSPAEEQRVAPAGAAQLPPPPVNDAAPSTTLPAPTDEDAQTEAPSAPQQRSEGGPGLLYLVGGAVVVGSIVVIGVRRIAKRRRRRRRRTDPRPAQRIAGAWLELVDWNVDQGCRPPSGRTIRERATVLAEFGGVPAGALAPLATIAEQAAFDPEEPTDAMAEEAWELLARLEHQFASTRGRPARLRGYLTRESLRVTTPSRRSGRRARDAASSRSS